MGVQKARIGTIAIGDVWRPSQIAAHVPNVDVSSGLLALAKAKKAEGEANAATAKMWAYNIAIFMKTAENVTKACVGTYKELDKRYQEASIENISYQNACRNDPTLYNAETAKTLEQNEQNALARRNGLGIFRTKAAEISQVEADNKWLENLAGQNNEKSEMLREKIVGYTDDELGISVYIPSDATPEPIGE